MNIEEIKLYIKLNPESDMAKAYDIGLRDKALELMKDTERLFPSKLSKKEL